MITPSIRGEGPITATIAVVGEFADDLESRLHRPIIGPKGDLFTKLLHASGISRGDIYVTLLIKQRVKESKYADNEVTKWFTIKKEDAWTSDGYKEYVALLKEELSKMPNLTTVIPLGNLALYALTGLVSIGKRRGSIISCTLIKDVKCIPTIRPTVALQDYIITYYIKHDLSRALQESYTRDLNLPERDIIVEPSFYMTMSYLEDCTKAEEIHIGNDIEVMNEEISCISVSLTPLLGISIPFIHNGSDYFSPQQELEIWRKLAYILENPNIKKIGQNYIFDMSFIFRKYGITIRNFECTMVAQGILYPDFPKGLDFICSIYTREPYYKDEGKKWFKMGGSYQDFWRYNCKDSMTCQEAFSIQKERLIKQGNWETYIHQRDLIHPLMFMQARGMKTDYEGMKLAGKQAEEKMIEKMHDLSKLVKQDVALKIQSDPDVYKLVDIAGEVFTFQKNEFVREQKHRNILNMGSTQQLANLFYNTLGHKPYMNKGAITTNDDALKRLVRKNIKEAFIIRDVRKIAKLKGTYYDMKLSEDNRIRSAMNPIGTVSGRLSSSQDIFGEGGNVQNLPMVMQQFILPDEGYVMYVCDLSQAENRTTANIAPEPLMLKAFADKIDIHSLTAGMISGIQPDEIKRQDNEHIYCSLGTGEYTWRFWGKKCNHSLNYDLGYRQFALRFEMTETEAKRLVDRFHRVYPGIRQYHAWVRAQLGLNMTLTNCYGRKRVFLDKWGDDLFKASYSWIPQSSIADKINTEGILFVYNNQQYFKHLELLNQIHDSLVFQIPISIGFAAHAQMLIRIKKSLEQPMTWHGNSFFIPLDFKMTTISMGNMKTVEISNDENIERLADKLHGVYKQFGTARQLPSVDSDLSDSSNFTEEMFSPLGS